MFFFNIWHFDISLLNITLSAIGETYMTIMCFSSNTKILTNPQNQKGYQLKQLRTGCANVKKLKWDCSQSI